MDCVNGTLKTQYFIHLVESTLNLMTIQTKKPKSD